MKLRFLQGGGVLADPSAMLQPVDAPPDIPPLPSRHPQNPAVRAAALGTYQQTAEYIFPAVLALLGFRLG